MGLAVGVVSFILFLLFQAQGIGAGDSGDLVSAAATFGVPHPPGYPLYSLLGWMANKLPFFTPAWRVGLLSSIPHAIVVGLVFEIAYRLSRRLDSALFAALLLAGNYLFFLYSTTQEVFALLSLFVTGLLFFVLRFAETQKPAYLYRAAVSFGLALGHHHLIVALLPVLVYWLTRVVGMRGFRISLIPLVLWFLVGLLPYAYIPVAARSSSVINWDRATTIPNFVRLVTRADYGTFRSGANIGRHPTQRFLALKAYAQILTLDFRLVGIVFLLAGVLFLPKNLSKVRTLLLLSLLLLGPAFFFYASFPLTNRFTLGTYERFMLPSYIIVVLFAALGHAKLTAVFARFLSGIASNFGFSRLLIAVSVITFLYPASILLTTLWRFWGFGSDRTSERLAVDMFLDVPQGSIVALSRDTPLFISQYMRYAVGFRADTMVIHGSFLNSSAYQQTLAGAFPSLYVPETKDTAISEFLVQNAMRIPVFANTRYPVDAEWFWVPHGLLFQLVNKDALPTLQETRLKNENIWKQTHSPDDGILSRYNHLMLSDVRDVYTASRMEYGRFLLRANMPAQAAEQFNEALNAGGDTERVDAYIYRGLSLLFDNRCSEALDSFETAKKLGLSRNAQVLLFEGLTYRDCVGDQNRAKELFATYDAERKASDQSLEGW